MGIRAQYMYNLSKRTVTDDTKIWFGAYRHTKMKDLPVKYLGWLKRHGSDNIKTHLKNKI